MSSRGAGNRALGAVGDSTSRKLVRTQTGKRVREFLPIETMKKVVESKTGKFYSKKEEKKFFKNRKKSLTNTCVSNIV